MSESVAVLGLWHQGVVAAACLADWGCDVFAADDDVTRVEKLRTGSAPVFEPGLDDLLRRQISSGRLRFTTDIAKAAARRSFVLITVDVPVDEHDRSDLEPVFRIARGAAPALAEGVVIVVTAQVPVGTCDEIAALVRATRPGLRFFVTYSPENLRLGQAIDRFRHPALPLIGGDDPHACAALERLFAPSGAAWHRCSIRTAEMSKHALNAFLALSVCFANEIGGICDEVGADGRRIAEVLRLEPRVGPQAMLVPGLGFSGGTLARDLQTLRGLGDRLAVDTPLFDGAWESNQLQNQTVVRRLASLLDTGLAGRRVAVLGLTYKPDTSTLRRSAALEVIGALVAAGASVAAHDPKADPAELSQASGFDVHDDPLAALEGAHALVLMTPWPQYKTLDFTAARRRMAGDIVFDTAGLWDSDAVAKAGLRYIDIGRGRPRR